jgi:VanZ family protein
MRVLAVLYVALLLAIVALADLGAIGPIVRLVHAIPCLDKVAHLVFATVLGGVVEAATGARGRALGIVAPVVLIEELSQRWVPGRTFDLLDLAADGAGLVLGTWLVARHGRSALATVRRS